MSVVDAPALAGRLDEALEAAVGAERLDIAAASALPSVARLRPGHLGARAAADAARPYELAFRI